MNFPFFAFSTCRWFQANHEGLGGSLLGLHAAVEGRDS